MRGEQELIVRYEPEKAIATLPKLLPEKKDRDRFLKLFDQLLEDQRVQKTKPLPEQVAMLERIRHTIGADGAAKGRRAPARAARRAQ